MGDFVRRYTWEIVAACAVFVLVYWLVERGSWLLGGVIK